MSSKPQPYNPYMGAQAPPPPHSYPHPLKPCPSTLGGSGSDRSWKIGCICILATLLVIFTALLIAFLVWALSHPAESYAKEAEDNVSDDVSTSATPAPGGSPDVSNEQTPQETPAPDSPPPANSSKTGGKNLKVADREYYGDYDI